MQNISKDIERLHEVIKGETIDRWSSIYSRSNEDLNIILKYIDVKDKDVYSVLSSSDMLFYLYLNGAKTVDTFDINQLTYRYYFFRKWLMEKGLIDASKLKFEEIKRIINEQFDFNCIDEEESKLFWNYYLDLQYKSKWYEEMLYNFYHQDALFETSDIEFIFPYAIDDIKKLLTKLNSRILKFNHTDILSEKAIIPEKQYDVVYLSNILDLADIKGVENAFNNIYKLLKPNGVIICVNIRNHPYFDLFSMQKEYFKSSFEFEEFYTELRGIAKAPIKYYKYIKK